MKANKNYGSKPHILVYVNLTSDGHNPPISSQQAKDLAKPYRQIFLSIWLLWGQRAILC